LPQPGLVSACVRHPETGGAIRAKSTSYCQLLRSSSLTDGFKDTIYEDSYRAYQEAKDGLKELELETEDRPVADNILGTLFLEHIAYLDSGIEHWLKVSRYVRHLQSDVCLARTQ